MTALARFVKRHRHGLMLRGVLEACELVHAVGRDWAEPRDAPGRAPGWRARWIPFSPPRPITRHERARLAVALNSQNTSAFDGPIVASFEGAFAERVGARHAIAVSSGTAALHVALAAVGVAPGDEVIVPVLSYVSCALAPLYLGASVRFVDADPCTWTLDARAVEAAITPRTKAILAVHLAGVPCDLDALRSTAQRHGVALVEDAAQAHGSTYAEHHVGTLGRLGCFSFQSSKTIVTGEGGMVVTDDDGVARAVRLARNLGEVGANSAPSLEALAVAADEPFGYASLGWNYRLGALAASIGLGQLDRFDAIVSAQRANAAWLREELAEIPGIALQQAPECATVCPPAVFLDLGPTLPALSSPSGGMRRDALAHALARERVDFRLPYRTPLSRHALFGAQGAFPVAERLCHDVLGFRVDPALGRSEMRAIGFALRRFAATQR